MCWLKLDEVLVSNSIMTVQTSNGMKTTCVLWGCRPGLMTMTTSILNMKRIANQSLQAKSLFRGTLSFLFRVLGIANQNYKLSQLEQQFQPVDLTFDIEVTVDSSNFFLKIELCPNECSKAIYGTIGYCSTQLLRCICLTSYDGDDCRYCTLFLPQICLT